MSQSEIERFAADLKSNAALRAGAEKAQAEKSAATPLHRAVAFAASKGYAFTADEAKEHIKAKAKAAGKEPPMPNSTVWREARIAMSTQWGCLSEGMPGKIQRGVFTSPDCERWPAIAIDALMQWTFPSADQWNTKCYDNWRRAAAAVADRVGRLGDGKRINGAAGLWQLRPNATWPRHGRNQHPKSKD
jgi:hypothetical protein